MAAVHAPCHSCIAPHSSRAEAFQRSSRHPRRRLMAYVQFSVLGAGDVPTFRAWKTLASADDTSPAPRVQSLHSGRKVSMSRSSVPGSRVRVSVSQASASIPLVLAAASRLTIAAIHRRDSTIRWLCSATSQFLRPRAIGRMALSAVDGSGDAVDVTDQCRLATQRVGPCAGHAALAQDARARVRPTTPQCRQCRRRAMLSANQACCRVQGQRLALDAIQQADPMHDFDDNAVSR